MSFIASIVPIGYPAANNYVTGQVVDADTGEYLPRATVTVVDAAGKYLNDGVTADSEGYFRLSSSLISGNMLMVTYTGYIGQMLDPADLMAYNVIQLEAGGDLDPVYVTAPKKGKTDLLLLLAVGAGLLLFTSKKG